MNSHFLNFVEVLADLFQGLNIVQPVCAAPTESGMGTGFLNLGFGSNDDRFASSNFVEVVLDLWY